MASATSPAPTIDEHLRRRAPLGGGDASTMSARVSVMIVAPTTVVDRPARAQPRLAHVGQSHERVRREYRAQEQRRHRR